MGSKEPIIPEAIQHVENGEAVFAPEYSFEYQDYGRYITSIPVRYARKAGKARDRSCDQSVNASIRQHGQVEERVRARRSKQNHGQATCVSPLTSSTSQLHGLQPLRCRVVPIKALQAVWQRWSQS